MSTSPDLPVSPRWVERLHLLFGLAVIGGLVWPYFDLGPHDRLGVSLTFASQLALVGLVLGLLCYVLLARWAINWQRTILVMAVADAAVVAVLIRWSKHPPVGVSHDFVWLGRITAVLAALLVAGAQFWFPLFWEYASAGRVRAAERRTRRQAKRTRWARRVHDLHQSELVKQQAFDAERDSYQSKTRQLKEEADRLYQLNQPLIEERDRVGAEVARLHAEKDSLKRQTADSRSTIERLTRETSALTLQAQRDRTKVAKLTAAHAQAEEEAELARTARHEAEDSGSLDDLGIGPITD